MSSSNPKANTINLSGMNATQIGSKLFGYLKAHQFDEFRLVIETLSQDSSRETDLEFILNSWNDKESGHFLLTHATDTNNIELVKFLLDHKVRFVSLNIIYI